MKPYYSDDLVTLYHADCLEHPDLWTGSDVLVTDPPYGMGWTGGAKRVSTDSARVLNDHTTDARDQVLSAWGNNKPALVFGTWRQPRPTGVKEIITWLKNQMTSGDLSLPWGPSHEEIYVLGDWTDNAKTLRQRAFVEAKVVPYGKGHERDHPTPKPVDLMEWLLERCNPAWTVADPFAGSGSTLVAAKALGRKAVGVELEEKYCEIAARRCAQDALPLWDLVMRRECG